MPNSFYFTSYLMGYIFIKEINKTTISIHGSAISSFEFDNHKFLSH